MRNLPVVFLLIVCFVWNCSPEKTSEKGNEKKPPEFMIGLFEDDYEIQYSVSDSTFILLPKDVYYIQKWELSQQYLITRNDSSNAFDPGKWTRIDWIKLEDMEPFEWAFCLSVFNANSAQDAESMGENVNPETPRTGCNGFPFSRMKRVSEIEAIERTYTH